MSPDTLTAIVIGQAVVFLLQGLIAIPVLWWRTGATEKRIAENQVEILNELGRTRERLHKIEGSMAIVEMLFKNPATFAKLILGEDTK